MSIETEVKVRIGNPENFCRRLISMKAEKVSSRHFEDNHLLDFPDGRLRSRRCLLRVRLAGEQNLLTFKGPPLQKGIFKIREEIEVGLKDSAAALQIFLQIGMQVSFRYQKYRREYLLDGVHVAVDETPIGKFVEFEGTQDAIRDLADKMEIPESEFLRLSYYSLYLEYCDRNDKTVGSMTF